MTIPAPTVEYSVVAPMLLVFGTAVAAVAVEAAVGPRRRFGVQLVMCAAALVAALITVIALAGTHQRAVMGALAIDGPALFAQGLILVVALLVLLLIAQGRSGGLTPQGAAIPGSADEQAALRAGAVQTAVFPLLMFAVGGMMLFPAADDLLTMFVALEVFSLPLYVLCGLARRRRVLSQEAALKYFLLGAFSSAFFLYGIAMLYGATGTMSLAGIGAHVERTPTVLLGVGLLTVGVLFKIGAIPFHAWIPDVYQGAPTSVTAFMAAATKIAAFGAMLRIFYVALPELRDDWRPVLSGVAMLTMVLGAVFAVGQTDMKRLLGYSAVAQAGFLMLGVVAANAAGITSTLFYLAAYGVCVIGAFAVVGLVRTADGSGEEASEISSWAGLGRRSPMLALAFALFLLAFAGIPLTSGFAGKFAVFQAAADGGAVLLVVVGVLASAVAAVVYARVILLMFFSEPAADAPHIVMPSRLTAVAITAAAAVTLAVGILPQPLLDLADRAGGFVT
ncbi:MAG: NADH-quinone oxidoreductase subunit NuoN [Mycobacterium sp.]